MSARRRLSAVQRFEQAPRLLVGLDRWLIRGHFPPTDRAIDPQTIPWAEHVAAHWGDIRRELDQLLSSGVQMPDIEDVMGVGNTADGPWTTYLLHSFGTWIEANAARCPVTTATVRDLPGLEIAGFTVLDGGTHIPLHRGPFRALRYQLGVRVPDPIGACRLQVGDDVLVWEDGKSLAFDDGSAHEAWNDADEPRYVFFVQTRWPLPGWRGVGHRGIHRLLARAARNVPIAARELDSALNG